MTDRRAFLGTIMAGVAGSLASPAPGAADVHRIPLIRDPKYRLLSRLHGVDLLAFGRLRRPGGWDGRAGDRYLHELNCRGRYDGNGGDWEFKRCWIEITACRPDPVLRVIGAGDFTCDQTSFVLTDIVRLHFASAPTLEIYVEAAAGHEVLVVAASSSIDLGGVEWIAPTPIWRPR